MALSDILTDPDSFFDQQATEPSWFIPIVLVMTTSFLAAIAASPGAELSGEAVSMVVDHQTQDANQTLQNVFATGTMVIAVGWTFIETLAGWLLYAVAFYAIAHFGFEGSGTFTDTIALTGWGYVPAVVNQTIAAVASYTVFGGVSLPESPYAAQETVAELQSDPILLASGIIGLALLAWSGVIWTYAMAKLHDLSRRDAAITAGIPVAFIMLTRINGIV